MNKLYLNRTLTAAIFLFVLSLGVNAQNYEFPLLERIVTINAENKTVESVLDDISRQAGIIFSYNPDAINAYSLVTYKAENKSVRFVLSDVLDNTVTFREMGKYVILQSEVGFREKLVLEGYLYDSRTGERISNASIYDKTLMKSAVTDSYGYFSIELSPLSDSTSFQICKNGYADTSIVKLAYNKNNRLIELVMNKIDPDADSTRSKRPIRVPSWLVPRNIWTNSVNIRESWSRAVQLSLVPGLGTNKLMGGNIENQFSLNIIGGYTGRVDILELGGVFNIVQGDAGYCQVGGVCNFVGETSKGVQIAGIYNSASNVKGTQVSGAINISKSSSDVQISGIANKSHDSRIQLTGIANFAKRSADLQVSGLLNNTDSVLVQVSGLANNADSALVQVSGLVNRAGYSKFLQVGLVNISDTSSGVNVGLINYSKKADGVNIGLINLVKNGYHKLEFSADEILSFNLAFRSGTKSFHSIITTGVRPFGDKSGTWGAGYGFGTSLGKSDKTSWDIEATSTELFYHKGLISDCQLYKLYAGIDRKTSGNFSVAAGITLNYLVVKWYTDFDYVYASLPPYSIRLAEDGSFHKYDSWVGARVALRFF